MTNKKLAIAAVITSLAVNAATAQESSGSFTVGFGGAYTSGHYIGGTQPGDTNNEGKVVPLLKYETDRFSIGVLEGASYTAYRDGPIEINLLAVPRYSGLDGTDIAALQGIKRKTTLDAGFGVNYSFGRTIVSATALAEITGEHDGFEIGAKVGRVSQLGKVVIAYAAGAVWQSEELTNYQFGVRTTEAVVGRPAFTTVSAITPFVEVGAEYAIADNWSIVAAAQLTYLPDDLSDSPIVGSNTALTLLTGIVHKF